MESIQYYLITYSAEIAIGTTVLVAAILIGMIIQAIAISKLKKRYNLLFKGESVKDVEGLMLSNKTAIEQISETNIELGKRLGDLESAMLNTFSKSGVYRYDAFTGLAGKLSFVYVLLDYTNTGVILNGIYSSEGHYLYIKEVIKGKTDKELSKEEKATLEQVMSNK